MNILVGLFFFLVGFAVLLLALTDLLWTTFLEGGPPISTHICHFAFHRTLLFCRGRNRRVIGLAGLSAIISTLITWTLLVWAGWAMIFSSSPGVLIDAATRLPADHVAPIYFAGTTIFTLGLGDYQPQGHFWQMLTSIAAGNGFLMFGTALAYLMAVVPAATQKRQLAVVIWALGKSPDDIIIRAWNGADSTALSPHLAVEVISETNRQHDVVTKMIDYAAAAIPEYWIVDPEAKTISAFILLDGKYLQIESAEFLRSRVMPGFAIDVADLFATAEKKA